MNFSVAVPEGKQCELLLYKAGSAAPAEQFPMEESVGEVHFLAVEGLDPAEYEYNYRIDGEVVVDPYARGLAGREAWGTERDAQKHEVRGVLRCDGYDWEGDRPLMIPQNQILAYSLHVRGFTKHSSSGVERKGTFEGVIEKLPYLTDLGSIRSTVCRCMSLRSADGAGITGDMGPGGSLRQRALIPPAATAERV